MILDILPFQMAVKRKIKNELETKELKEYESEF